MLNSRTIKTQWVGHSTHVVTFRSDCKHLDANAPNTKHRYFLIQDQFFLLLEISHFLRVTWVTWCSSCLMKCCWTHQTLHTVRNHPRRKILLIRCRCLGVVKQRPEGQTAASSIMTSGTHRKILEITSVTWWLHYHLRLNPISPLALYHLALILSFARSR